MKKFFTMLLLLSLVSSLSACNYKAIDDALHDKVNETADKLQNSESVPSGMDVIEDSSTGTTAYIPSDATKDKIEIKGIGESFPSRIPYLDGVEYTLKGYTYYESFVDSGIPHEELSISDDEYYDDVLSRCGFYLIDMSVSYNGSEEYPEELGDYPIYCDLIPAETDREESVNNASADELLQDGSGYAENVYQSAHPSLDDPETARRYWYLPALEPGETMEFQIGILCTKNYVRDHCIYLCVGKDDLVEYPTVQYFALSEQEGNS